MVVKTLIKPGHSSIYIMITVIQNSEEPRPKVGASSKEKAISAWVLAPPNLQSAIHPRAKHGAFWLFHVMKGEWG